MRTPYPSEQRRRALKSAILRAARTANVPDLADLQRTSRDWSKAEYEALTARFGIDLASLDLTVVTSDASDTSGTDTSDASETSDAPADDAQTLAAKADMAKLDELWGRFDIAGHRAATLELAMRANKPAPDPIVVHHMANGTTPIARRIATRTAGEVFGLTGPQARMLLPVYDAADTPAIDPHFVWPDALSPVLVMAVQEKTGCFLCGPAGTGKTTMAEQIAARLGRPFVRVSCTANTDAAQLVGMTVPDNGGVRFQPGILTRAITRPGVVLLIDEPSTARDGIMYVLQSLLDAAKAISIDETGDVFHLAPDAMVFLADNTNGAGDQTGAYAGTRNLSFALTNRVAMFNIGFLPADQEIAILRARTGASHELAERIVSFANLTRAKVSDGELPTSIGLRPMVRWSQLLQAGIAPQTAAEVAFLNASTPDAREVYQQLLTTHCEPDEMARIAVAVKG